MYRNFKLKNPEEWYKHCYSEYFTEKYPPNFFKNYIDIGACGTCHKWHINHMGKDNPETLCIGFEPEEKLFNIIKTECSSLSNVHLHKSFFGKDISLKELIKKYNIDPKEKWCLSCDCEGDEKYLFNNKDELKLLKTAEHIAFEIHPSMCNIGYEKFVELFIEHFGDTHKIIRTFHGGKKNTNTVFDNSSFFLVKFESFNKIIKPTIDNLKYNWSKAHHCAIMNGRLRPEHFITYIN